MKLEITPKAIEWFKREIKLPDGMGINFHGKVYGSTQVHEGFSVGMTVAHPENILESQTHDGLLFYTEVADEWFFQGFKMTVDYDEKLDEPKYFFTEE